MKRRIRAVLIALLLLGAAALFAAIAGAFYVLRALPPAELLGTRKVAESTKIYDRTGTVLLYEIHGEERRTIIPFEEIPEIVKQSTIAVEDSGFYSHLAFDWKSIARAFAVNLFKGGVVQGGSTITQQLAKNAFLTPERTFTRKIKELVLSLQLERKLSKDEILELYLNQIPYGSNAYGIESASLTFFGKSAKSLSLAEAATLAALPKAPSYYSPWGEHKDTLLERRNFVLEKMAFAGFINDKEKTKAIQTPMKFEKPFKGIKAPHFVIMVQDYLNRQYGENFVRTNGLKVITTLDWNLQQLAERVITDGAKRNAELYKGKNAALVAQDPKTGQLLALVGSKDYFDTANEGNFNVAAQGLRQPGSAIKPFIYLAAFKKGYAPETIMFDLETEFDTTGDPEKSYKPGNYDGRFRGPITIRNALAQSINIPAVKTLYLVGLNDALKTAKSFGLTTLTEKSRYGLSLVLGGGEVKLIDMANAYSVFAEEGVKHRQALIMSVSAKNKILEEYRDQNERVVEPQYARLINDVLSDASARAPIFGSSLNLPSLPDHQVAVKTGTTNDYRDAWTVGYTPSLTVGVWAGNNDNSPMTKEGASIAAAVPIWKTFMNEALKPRPAESFTKPEETLSAKPILRGEYILLYQADGRAYPQIHDLLFYIDKNNPLGPDPLNPENDSQFSGWEKALSEWAAKNIPNFSAYNQPLPINSVLVENPGPLAPSYLDITIARPLNGDFLAAPFTLDAKISSSAGLKKIEVYFNDALIDSKSSGLGSEYRYFGLLNPPIVQLQNILKVVAYDEKDNRTERSLIAYSSATKP